MKLHHCLKTIRKFLNSATANIQWVSVTLNYFVVVSKF